MDVKIIVEARAHLSFFNSLAIIENTEGTFVTVCSFRFDIQASPLIQFDPWIHNSHNNIRKRTSHQS